VRQWLIVSLILVLWGPSLPAHAASAAELTAFKVAIRKMYDLKEAAFRDHDPLPIVNQFYTEDATSVGPGDVYLRGRKEFLEEYQKHMSSTVRIVSVQTHLNGNNGLDWANFYITPADPAVKPFSFKILFLWEKRGQEWRCIGDMFVTGKFPEPAEAQ
jgi:ketosteroid isomerase-like protein